MIEQFRRDIYKRYLELKKEGIISSDKIYSQIHREQLNGIRNKRITITGFEKSSWTRAFTRLRMEQLAVDRLRKKPMLDKENMDSLEKIREEQGI